MKDFKVYQTSGMLNFLVSEASDVRKKEQTVSGSIVSFNADQTVPVLINSEINADSGATGLTIYHTGANMLNAVPDNVIDYSSSYRNYTLNDGDVTITGRTLMGFIVPVVPNTAYTATIYKGNTVDQIAVRIREFSTRPTSWESSGFIVQSVNVNTTQYHYVGAQFTTTAQTRWVVVCVYRSGAPSDTLIMSDFSLRVGTLSYSTPYAPYNGTEYDISWADTAGLINTGTVAIDYDGSVTLETGGQTYTLTSISPIETQIGDNNIWSDAGPVSVTYPI